MNAFIARRSVVFDCFRENSWGNIVEIIADEHEEGQADQKKKGYVDYAIEFCPFVAQNAPNTLAEVRFIFPIMDNQKPAGEVESSPNN